MIRQLFNILFATAVLFAPLAATTSPASETSQNQVVSVNDQQPVAVQLIHEDETIQAGRPFWVAIRVTLADHWHTYWKNPGDTGFPMSIDWKLPQGFQVESIEWPFPKRLDLDDTVGFGFENEVVLLARIMPPKALSNAEKINIGADLRWLVCSDASCLPGDAKVSLDLTVSSNAPKPSTKWEKDFEKARSKLPKNEWTISAVRKKDRIELIAVAKDGKQFHLTDAQFFPETNETVNHKDKGVFQKGQEGQYVLSLTLSEQNANAQMKQIKGVLVAFDKSNPQITHAVDVDLLMDINPQDIAALSEDEKAAPSTSKIENNMLSSADVSGSVLWTLLFAFVGGMILNLMPCVLPVISLKVLGFVNMSGQSRSESLKHGLSFFGGVLVSFWVLAGIILALQAYGHAVGWGFQLQEPLFVAILAAVLIVFSLSLFGVFEIGAVFASWAGQKASDVSHPQGNHDKTGLVGSFFSGVLATAVATPCTGPFLGSALGFAMTLSPIYSLLIFTAIGVGMALPYVLLAAYPSLLKFLPKPGPWMVTFKEMMGFLMLATVCWLVWVFGAETDYFAVFLLLIGFLTLSFGCWIYGRWGSPIKKRTTRMVSTIIASVFFILGGYVIFNSATGNYIPQTASQDVAMSKWEPFSMDRVKELQALGIPVLIDFTAKWCLICQTNHLVFLIPEVNQRLDDLGVVRMVADWTRNDPEITKALKEYGRSGVPLYILHGKDPSETPAVLPQVLTADNVLEHLDKIDSHKG